MQKRDKYNHLDITGQRYGKLVAIKKVGVSTWEFHCDCGNDVVLKYSRILYGQLSCGCMRKDVAKEWVQSHTKHGESRTKLYRKYRAILERCYRKESKHFHRYGGRGITVCDEWKNSFEAFRDWAYENGYDPEKSGYQWSIDRIDNNKGYSPENCRFTTAREQMRNREITKLYEYNGNMYTAPEFADIYGIEKSLVYNHVKKGQSLGEILDYWNRSHSVPDGFVDVKSFAEMNGVTATSVNRWIKDGKIYAEKYGRKWYIRIA